MIGYRFCMALYVCLLAAISTALMWAFITWWKDRRVRRNLLYSLFAHMSIEHNLHLLDSEMYEIVRICRDMWLASEPRKRRTFAEWFRNVVLKRQRVARVNQYGETAGWVDLKLKKRLWFVGDSRMIYPGSTYGVAVGDPGAVIRIHDEPTNNLSDDGL